MIRKSFKTLLYLIVFFFLSQFAYALNIVELSPGYYPNTSRGRPLSSADIYVGKPDLDPEIIGNQKTLSVQQEDGTITAVSQPIHTNAGGVPQYAGSPVVLLVEGDYSLKVLDSHGSQIYYVPSTAYEKYLVSGNYYYPDYTEADQGVVGGGETVTDILADVGATENATIYFSHNSGGNTTTYTFTTNTAITDNFDIIIEDGVILDGAGTLTLDNPNQTIASSNQYIFGSTITIGFTNGGIVHPGWWGIDGTADNVQINAANDALPASGGIVEMLAQDYTLNAMIELSDNVWLRGKGQSTILVVPDSGYAGSRAVTNDDISGGNSNIKISDFAIKVTAASPYQGSPSPSGSILFVKVTGLKVQNIYTDSYDSQLSPLDLRGGCSNVIISGCHLANVRATVAGGAVFIRGASGSVDDGDSSYDSHDITIVNNILESGKDEALAIWGWYNDVYNIVISGNLLSNPAGIALGTFGSQTAGQTASVAENITISGNYISGKTNILSGAKRIVFDGNSIKASTSAREGIMVQDSASLPGTYPTDISVSNNTIYNTLGSGIQFEAIRGIISGNTIHTAGSHGIDVNDGSSYVSVSDNYIYNATTMGISIGACSDITIQDNYVHTAAYGIRMATGSAQGHIIVKDNTIIDPGTYGIDIDGGGTNAIDNLEVENNIIRASAATNGIYVHSGTYTGTTVLNNKVYGATTDIELSGEAVLSQGNMKGDPFTVPVESFSVNDISPSVLEWDIYKTANNIAKTIIMFDEAVQGKRIKVLINDVNTTIDFTGTNLKGNAGVDWTPTTGDWMEGWFDGTDWYISVHDTTP